MIKKILITIVIVISVVWSIAWLLYGNIQWVVISNKVGAVIGLVIGVPGMLYFWFTRDK